MFCVIADRQTRTKGGVQPKRIEKAQGMIEFALTLPLLLLLIFGIMELGRLLFYYSAVTTASREAARFGSAAGGLDGTGNYYQDCSGMRAAAKRIGSFAGVADGNISITFDRFVGGSFTTIGNCNTTFSVAGGDVKLGDRVVVSVTTKFVPIIPLLNMPEFNINSITRRTIVKDVQVK